MLTRRLNDQEIDEGTPTYQSFSQTFKREISDYRKEVNYHRKDDTFLIMEKSNIKPSLDQLVNNEMMRLLQQTNFPILMVPQECTFESLDKICLVGNAAGLSDHPLLHQLAAHFLPRVFTIKNKKVEQIHWNNVFQVPEGIPAKNQLLPTQMNQLFEKTEIKMVILPIPHKRPWWRSLWEINFIFYSKIPVLIFPL
jgi:hypothetical protein